MRKLCVCFGLVAGLALGQEKPETAPDAVVAVVNGRKMTADEVKKMVAGLPAQVQKAFTNDPKQFMNEYAWYMNLQAAAEKAGLENQSPYKEILAFNRMFTLVQAESNDAYLRVEVTPAQQQQAYEKSKEKYRETKAKLIYVPFGQAGEAAAKAEADKVVQQARGGVDFVKLVKEHSKDTSSAAQNGDMGMAIRTTTTQVPEPIRKAILALKPGQIGDPVRHENGYYIFRVESSDVLSYEKVKDEIYKELKDVGYKEWTARTKSQASVRFENEAFFQAIKQEAPAKPSGK